MWRNDERRLGGRTRPRMGGVGSLLRVPTGLLARMRWLFMCFALFNIAGLIAQLLPVTTIPAGTRLVAVALLVGLGAWWVRGYRRGGFSVRGQLFEAGTLFLAALASGDPYQAFGLLYTGTNFRSLYGSRGAVISYSVLHIGACLAAFLVAPAMNLEPDLQGFLRQVPGVPVLAALAHIIARTVMSQERGLLREGVLLRAGTRLSAYGDRAAISRTGVEAAEALLVDLPDAGAIIRVATADGHEVVASSGVDLPSPPAALSSGGSRLLMPLRTGQGLQGELEVTGARAIPEEVRSAIETLAVQLGLALENASLTDDLRARAFTDSLTGLANRASLLERVAAATEAAKLRGDGRRGFAVLLIDLDGFKSVNDAHGHAVGDRLLVAAAQRLRHSIRPGDLAARLGGDEFAALLTGLDDVDARAVAERVVAALRTPFVVDGTLLTAEGSVGLAHWAGHADADAVLRDADAAMYAAKAAGKGRLVVSGDGAGLPAHAAPSAQPSTA